VWNECAISLLQRSFRKEEPKSLAMKESVISYPRTTDEGCNRRIMNDGGNKRRQTHKSTEWPPLSCCTVLCDHRLQNFDFIGGFVVLKIVSTYLHCFQPETWLAVTRLNVRRGFSQRDRHTDFCVRVPRTHFIQDFAFIVSHIWPREMGPKTSISVSFSRGVKRGLPKELYFRNPFMTSLFIQNIKESGKTIILLFLFLFHRKIDWKRNRRQTLK
jgi:hypothetical protein